MITKLILRNFKSVDSQEYNFTQFDLLVGRNNSSKSTVLQALGIWQFCVDEFHRSKRSGSKGIQVVLPNFTALPVPEFNLLWKDRTERMYPQKKQEYILISIQLEWMNDNGEFNSFGVDLRYQSPQTIYAIPSGGWAKFRECEKKGDLPTIAYVPPFSGLEPTEKWLDISPIRQQVGKGQPGSVLRNLLLRVCPQPVRGVDGRIAKNHKTPEDWKELSDIIERWFSVKILEPKYDSAKDVYISVDYQQKGKNYDIISGGSGFHQVLTLLAFLYGYKPALILLDEPDAHLHVNLQRQLLDFFKRKSLETKTQFIIATHAEEFVRGVDASQIISLLSLVPQRIQATAETIRAMADVSNEEITRLMSSPYILYVEGDSDERLIRAWASQYNDNARDAINKICFKSMGGGSKKDMKAAADIHFNALKQIIPTVSRLILFDYDDTESYHPDHDNPSLAEWSRKNIENYLLVPDAWKRAAQKKFTLGEIFLGPLLALIDNFFKEQNLTLPPNKNWRNVNANIFCIIDGKRILFENKDSLFQTLRSYGTNSILLLRETVAMSMNQDEIHEDVHQFINKLIELTHSDGANSI